MRHSRFPLARRALDQEPADPFRRLSGQPGDARRILAAALRHGGRVSASASPGRGHRALASLYRAGKVPARGDAEYRQSASGFRHCADDVVELHGNTTYATCLDCDERYELAWVRERFEARRRAPDCGCGGFIKTATVSFGQAMPDEAMQRAEELTLDLRSVSRHRLVARGVAGGRISA